MSTPTITKYKILTFAKKAEIIREVDKNEKKKGKVAKDFEIPVST